MIPTLRRGGSKAHTKGEDHWTVRGVQDRKSKYTFHVYPGGKKSEGWPDGGKRWRNEELNVEQSCWRLEDTGVIAREERDQSESSSINGSRDGSWGMVEPVEANVGEVAGDEEVNVAG